MLVRKYVVFDSRDLQYFWTCSKQYPFVQRLPIQVPRPRNEAEKNIDEMTAIHIGTPRDCFLNACPDSWESSPSQSSAD